MNDKNRSDFLTILSKLQDITGIQITSNFDPDLVPIKYDIENGNTTLIFEKNITGQVFHKVEVRRFEEKPHSCNYTIKANLFLTGSSKSDIAVEIGNKIVRLYGADDNQNELITERERAEMVLGVWTGRSWLTNDKHPVKVMMFIDEGDFEVTFFLS